MLLVKPWSLGSLKMESCGKPGKSVVSIMTENLANLLSPSWRRTWQICCLHHDVEPGKSVVSIMTWNLANLLSPSWSGTWQICCLHHDVETKLDCAFSTPDPALVQLLNIYLLQWEPENSALMFSSYSTVFWLSLYMLRALFYVFITKFFNTALCSTKILNNFYLSFKVFKHFDGKF